ncbi:MAG TPA: porin [Bdellovibrionota bacterium]|nr:porin [Bdellovibrionota bacterium]
MNRTEVTKAIAALLFGYALASPAWAQEEQKPEAAAPAPKVSDIVGYDKGFYIQSADGKFKLVTGGYIQGAFNGQIAESGSETDTFRIRRARLKWYGHLFSKNVQYQAEYDFSSSKNLSTYLQLVHSDPFKVRVGQWKVPFNLEGIASGSVQQFVDRSIAHSFFGVPDEREIGFGFNGTLMDKWLEYEVAAMNGEGINTLNQNNEFRYVGRLVANLKGHHGLEFCDTKNSDEPNVAFAVAGMYNDTLDPSTGTPPTDEMKVTSITADLSAKFRGFGAHGAFYYMNTKPDAGGSTHDKGFLAQGGYFVMPEKLELGARIARVFVDGGGDTGEYTLGLNYYMFKAHHVKFQFDYSALTTEDGVAAGDDRLDHRVRAQLQVKI